MCSRRSAGCRPVWSTSGGGAASSAWNGWRRSTLTSWPPRWSTCVAGRPTRDSNQARSPTWPQRATGGPCGSPLTVTRSASGPGAPTGSQPTCPRRCGNEWPSGRAGRPTWWSSSRSASGRAKQASRLSAVVVRFSRSRKRYERQGILVEEAALEQAEAQCLADEDARARRRERDRQRRADQDLTFQVRLAEAVARLFPGCPAERAEAIACHASVRGSGRVGRSAAGRALDEQAVTLAVVASIRHHDTGYDELLMTGVPREEARARVRPAIDRVLAAWQHP